LGASDLKEGFERPSPGKFCSQSSSSTFDGGRKALVSFPQITQDSQRKEAKEITTTSTFPRFKEKDFVECTHKPQGKRSATLGSLGIPNIRALQGRNPKNFENPSNSAPKVQHLE
jgi:hypothetical protein